MTTSSSPTPSQYFAAQQFIEDCITNNSLLQSYSDELQTVANQNVGNTANANLQTTLWLLQQNYDTTPTLIYQAFLFAKNNNLAFWTGIYGNSKVFYPDTLTLTINNAGIITYNKQVINGAVATANNDNTLTVSWGFTNNATAAVITFSVTDDGNCFKGTLQLEVNGVALIFKGTAYNSANSFATLGAFAGSYDVDLYGYAPVLSILPDNASETGIPYLGGIALTDYSYTPADPSANPTAPSLSWTNQQGTSGNITFYFDSPLQLASASNTLSPNPDGGLWFYGSLTFAVGASNQTWDYQGIIAQPTSFPLSNWAGNYGATLLTPTNATISTTGPEFIVQSDGKGSMQVLLDGVVINNWSYNSAYNYLSWTTADNGSEAYLSFSLSQNTNSNGLSFSGVLIQDGSTQDFEGTLSDIQTLADCVGIYCIANLIPQGDSDDQGQPGPVLTLLFTNNAPVVTLDFGNSQIATLPTSDFNQITKTLSWTSSTGVNTQGSIDFARQDAPTSDSNYVGNFVVGSLILANAVGAINSGTYQYKAINGQLSSGYTSSPTSSSGTTNSGSTSSNNSNSSWKDIFSSWSNFGKWLGGITEAGALDIAKGLLNFPKLIIQSIPAFIALEIIGKIVHKEPKEMTAENAPAVEQTPTTKTETLDDGDNQPADLQVQQSSGLKKNDQQVNDATTVPSTETTTQTSTVDNAPKKNIETDDNAPPPPANNGSVPGIDSSTGGNAPIIQQGTLGNFDATDIIDPNSPPANPDENTNDSKADEKTDSENVKPSEKPHERTIEVE